MIGLTSVNENGEERIDRRATMKWAARRNARVGRIACPWPIPRFVDAAAERHFVSENQFADGT
jgi:hypothetical protein